MIDPAARGVWRDLEAKVRPFVARRVRAPADVDDIVQDVFLRMHRSLATLREDERFGAWVYQVARSAVAEHQRSSARHPVVSVEPAESSIAAPVQEHDGDAAVTCELASFLAPFVAALPSPYREALTLTELEGLMQKDAASMLGISLSGMKSRVQRGREHLRASLEACCRIALDTRGRVVDCEPRQSGHRPDGCCG